MDIFEGTGQALPGPIAVEVPNLVFQINWEFIRQSVKDIDGNGRKENQLENYNSCHSFQIAGILGHHYVWEGCGTRHSLERWTENQMLKGLVYHTEELRIHHKNNQELSRDSEPGAHEGTCGE